MSRITRVISLILILCLLCSASVNALAVGDGLFSFFNREEEVTVPKSEYEALKRFEKLAEMSAANISTESNPRPMTKEDYLNVLKMAYEAK